MRKLLTLAWVGWGLSVVSAVIDHDADYILGSGLSNAASAVVAVLDLWIVIALTRRRRWAVFAYVAVAVLQWLLMGVGFYDLTDDNQLVFMLDVASVLVLPTLCSLMLCSRQVRSAFGGRIGPMATLYIVLWLAQFFGWMLLVVRAYEDGSSWTRCVAAARAGSHSAAQDLVESLVVVQSEAQSDLTAEDLARAYENAGVAVYAYVNGCRVKPSEPIDEEEKRLNDALWESLDNGAEDVDSYAAANDALQKFVSAVLSKHGRFDAMLQAQVSSSRAFADGLRKLRPDESGNRTWRRRPWNGYPSWSPRNW